MIYGGNVRGNEPEFKEQTTLPGGGTLILRIADELPHTRLEHGGREKEALRQIADQSFAEMGIHCPPIPPEELQKMMLESGIRPEENLFSRGIIEMREE